MKLFNRIFGKPKISLHFNHGPFLEIESGSGHYDVLMYDGDELVHTSKIPEKHWTKANRKYFCNWKIEVRNSFGKKVLSHRMDLRNQIIRINLDSKSLGDTLAWVPQVHAFSKKHKNCRVYVSQFWPDLFDQKKYPELQFIQPETVVENCYATYNLGYYFENTSWHHPLDPRKQPLGKVAADILGIPYVESRPYLQIPTYHADLHKKTVCIATASTAECKLWNHHNGWQKIIDYLVKLNYEVLVVQKEPTLLKNVTDETGDKPIGKRIERILQCDFFIGLGSGLSWLAWALEKPVILISGFSEPWAEFESLCERVINQDVCHGCWNDPTVVFDRNDWYWCPRHKNTDRAFECSTSITEDMVRVSIQKLEKQFKSQPIQ
ncbi:MAG: autotransporter strand-loop-strand O-heptosyltransferase [Acidiferrobacterales bacterium]|nr:autotransporter strand-loop-strand O-heptosyltransferase [Acidiferrobacterales bacterium]